MANRYDVVVVGAGLGGLSAAAAALTPRGTFAGLAPALGLAAVVSGTAFGSTADSGAIVKKERDPNRLEVGGVPVLMGDSDLGVGVGGVVSLARFSEECSPFRWQLLAMIFLTLKSTGDGVETVYQDHMVRLDLPWLLGGRVRLRSDVSLARHQNAGYYGIGNAAAASEAGDRRRYQYDRIYPSINARAQVKLTRHLSSMVGAALAYNWFEVYPGSKLAEDLSSRDEALRELVRGTGDHYGARVDLGLLWDTRDHDLVPTSGAFHELSARFTPDPRSDLSYGGATLALRVYRSVYRDRLVFAARILGDVLFGRPPFYELARHGGLFPMPAPGGGSGVRGVPVHRYHGRIKLISNWELRVRALPFTWLRQRFNIGAVAFVDAGRVWADLGSPARLDGTGPGLKVGAGGGLRVQWGEALLLRADLAWSPDADPVGLYFNARHVF